MGFKNYILVCGGTGCETSKSYLFHNMLIAEGRNQGVAEYVYVIKID